VSHRYVQDSPSDIHYIDLKRLARRFLFKSYTRYAQTNPLNAPTLVTLCGACSRGGTILCHDVQRRATAPLLCGLRSTPKPSFCEPQSVTLSRTTETRKCQQSPIFFYLILCLLPVVSCCVVADSCLVVSDYRTGTHLSCGSLICHFTSSRNIPVKP
jgi:hypothetical protein